MGHDLTESTSVIRLHIMQQFTEKFFSDILQWFMDIEQWNE